MAGMNGVGVIVPPPDIKSVIDKTAGYVAKHGEDFERKIIAQQAGQPKFAFLQEGNPYKAYYLKKSLDDSTPALPKALEDHKKAELEKLRKKEEKKQERLMLQDTQAELAPPAPSLYTRERHFVSPVDDDIIRVTAQFVARNGSKFMEGLLAREGNNPQFDFLNPKHRLFSYFTGLIDIYTKVVLPPKDELTKLRAIKEDRIALMEKITRRAQFNMQEDRRRKDKEKADKEEREQMSKIDWHDFKIVETLEFTEADERLDLPPPIDPKLGRQVGVGAPKALDSSLASATPVIQMAKELEEVEMQDEEEEEIEIQMDAPPKVAAAPPPSAPHPAPPMRFQAPPPSHEEEAGPHGSKEREKKVISRLDPSKLKIKKDYERKRRVEGAASFNPDALVVCPISGQKVRQAEFSDHLRIVLLDPQWKLQKDKVLEEARKESVYEDNIESNLADFIVNRPDLYGSVDDQINMHHVAGAERDRMQASQNAGSSGQPGGHSGNGALTNAPGHAVPDTMPPPPPPMPPQKKTKTG